MRQLRFRFYDKLEEEMVYSNKSCLSEFFDEYDNSLPNVEIMQFTGLFDKRGKELYEGDIVKYERCTHRWTINEFIGIVEYDKRCLCYFLNFYTPKQTISHNLSKSVLDSDSFITTRNYEVIGNIYEHSHLLDNN